MKRLGVFFVLIFFALTLFTAFRNRQIEQKQLQPPDLVTLTRAFISSLDKDLHDKAVFSLEDEERKNWHYIPRDRKGVSFKMLNSAQRQTVKDILKLSLSAEGYKKTMSIVSLEGILREIEKRPLDDPYRDSTNYSFSIFGTPAKNKPWGWRFEGHHLSLNFSSVTNRIIAATPSFWGSNPATVLSGTQKGLQVLKSEENLAKELLAELDSLQLKKTTIMTEAPAEIITTNSKRADLGSPIGLSYGEMNARQKSSFLNLLNIYLNNYTKELANDMMHRIKLKDINQLHFAWAGGTNIDQGHYYRIHGPTILIEFDNTQNNVNHVHTVVRDLENDFGGDLLKQHYEHGHNK